MRFLFVMRNAHYLRNFESVVRDLAERHHLVDVALEMGSRGAPAEVRALLREISRMKGVSVHEIGPAPLRAWATVGSSLRSLRDYSRYMLPVHRRATRCAARARKRVPRLLRIYDLIPDMLRPPVAKVVSGFCRLADSVVAPQPEIVDTLRRFDPDVLLITPVVDLDIDQDDYIKAARDLRIPSVVCVASWDNLTNKGLINVKPDRVFVWNEAQKKEAVTLHDIPPSHVVVTGAQIFDWWFGAAPSTTRQEFCATLGVDPANPILLYTASTFFICPNEPDYVRQWIAAIRSCDDPVLRRATIIVRPHPKNSRLTGMWRTPGIIDVPGVLVYPQDGGMPVTQEGRAVYFDSIWHSAALVGINTSAMVEAAIVGRRSYTVVLPEYAEGQEGMVHFQHLTEDGFLGIAHSWDEHVQQLAVAVNHGDAELCRSFTERFVRPFGLDRPATPVFSAHAESLEDMPLGSNTLRLLRPVLRLLLLPLLALAAVEVRRQVRQKERQAARALAKDQGTKRKKSRKIKIAKQIRRFFRQKGRMVRRLVRETFLRPLGRMTRTLCITLRMPLRRKKQKPKACPHPDSVAGAQPAPVIAVGRPENEVERESI